jgi:hypothetical protein
VVGAVLLFFVFFEMVCFHSQRAHAFILVVFMRAAEVVQHSHAGVPDGGRMDGVFGVLIAHSFRI